MPKIPKKIIKLPKNKITMEEILSNPRLLRAGALAEFLERNPKILESGIVGEFLKPAPKLIDKYALDMQNAADLKLKASRKPSPHPEPGYSGNRPDFLKDLTDYANLNPNKTIFPASSETKGTVSQKFLADLDRAQKQSQEGKTRSEKLEQEKLEGIAGDLEKSKFYGEHAPETLALARERTPFWRQADTRYLRRQFIIDKLRLTEEEADILKSGKGISSKLRDLFAGRMAEWEVTGHLPKELSGMPSTRIVSYGDYFLEKDAWHVATYPSTRKSLFVPLAQQRGAVQEAFVPTRYTLADTGKLLDPEKISRITVAPPLEETAALEEFLGKFKTRKDIGEYIEAKIKIEEPLAKRERVGWVDPNTIRPVDLYENFIGKPGQRKPSIKIGDENEILSQILEEVAEEPVPARPDPWSLTGEETSGILEEWGAVNPRERSIGYRDRPYSHRNLLTDLRSFKRRYLRYKSVKGVPGKGGVIEKLVGYKPGLLELFEKAKAGLLREAKGKVVNVKGWDLERFAEYITNVPTNMRVYLRKGGGLHEINVAAAEGFSQIPGLAKNLVPPEAAAEKVFEVYFKEIEGKKGLYGAYTEAGTLVGKRKGRPTSLKAYGKIFPYKGGYRVGVLPAENAFYKGESDYASKGEEIRDFYDVPQKGRLIVEPEMQVDLTRMYFQRDLAARKLMRKYQWNSAIGAWEDLEKGEVVDAKIVTEFKNKLVTESAARRKASVKEAFANINKANLGKAEKGIEGKLGRGKNILFAALGLSALLVASTAFSSKRRIMSMQDIPRQDYGSTTDDERMFRGRPMNQRRALITPEYSGPMGYRTNIDVDTTDNVGVDHRNFSDVMNRHVTGTLGTSRGQVNMEINDNSDSSTSYQLQKRYSNMLRA